MHLAVSFSAVLLDFGFGCCFILLISILLFFHSLYVVFACSRDDALCLAASHSNFLGPRRRSVSCLAFNVVSYLRFICFFLSFSVSLSVLS